MATQYTQTSAHGASAVVHRDHVGFVIGRKYQAINAVARQTKTRIQVNDQDKGCPFVTFVIGGRSVEDVQSAHHGVMELARRAEAATPRVGQMAPMNHFAPFQMIALENRVVVAGEDVGMVLGSKGSTLRKISNDTWTWIKFLKGTDKTAPTFSVRGFLVSDIEEATKRILGIATESLNRRSGGPRHHRVPRATEPISMSAVAGEFKMAPVPQSKRVSFKVKSPKQPVSPSYAPHSPQSPSNAPHTPSYAPHTPSNAPHTPQTPQTPPSA